MYGMNFYMASFTDNLAKVGGGDGYFAKGVKALFTKQK